MLRYLPCCEGIPLRYDCHTKHSQKNGGKGGGVRCVLSKSPATLLAAVFIAGRISDHCSTNAATLARPLYRRSSQNVVDMKEILSSCFSVTTDYIRGYTVIGTKHGV